MAIPDEMSAIVSTQELASVEGWTPVGVVESLEPIEKTRLETPR